MPMTIANRIVSPPPAPGEGDGPNKPLRLYLSISFGRSAPRAPRGDRPFDLPCAAPPAAHSARRREDRENHDRQDQPTAKAYRCR